MLSSEQRVEALGGAVDRGAEAGGAAADDEQVDLLARRELAADPERARDLAGRGCVQLAAAREPHEREARRVEPATGVAAGSLRSGRAR